VHWFASFTNTNHTTPWKDWHPYPVAVQLLKPHDAIAFLSGFDNGGQADIVALTMDLGLLPC
jgi:hypothetical protein